MNRMVANLQQLAKITHCLGKALATLAVVQAIGGKLNRAVPGGDTHDQAPA
ncbi:hypothetical protein D3C75_1157510 [compost metagenome]